MTDIDEAQQAINQWRAAAYGDSNDAELEAATEVIEALHSLLPHRVRNVLDLNPTIEEDS